MGVTCGGTCRRHGRAVRRPDVRVVVVAAQGPHFSVGLDLKAMGRMLTGGGVGHGGGRPSMAARARSGRAEVLRLQDAITAVARCPKPVIAAVHGYCIGGGVDLIAACDIRLASSDAVFSVREAKMAIVADLGSLQRLPAIIGAGHLAEFEFTGKDISAERAKEIGLVNEVATDVEGVHKAAQTSRGRDRSQLPPRRPGHQGRPGGQRRADRGRGARLCGHLERRDAGLRRSRRSHDRFHGEALPEIHGSLGRGSTAVPANVTVVTPCYAFDVESARVLARVNGCVRREASPRRRGAGR